VSIRENEFDVRLYHQENCPPSSDGVNMEATGRRMRRVERQEGERGEGGKRCPGESQSPQRAQARRLCASRVGSSEAPQERATREAVSARRSLNPCRK